MSLVLTTPPGTEPVTLAEAKAQTSVFGSDHDTKLGRLITAAREYVENYTGLVMIDQTWTLYLDNFESETKIPNPPLQSVATVKYIDTGGVQQTLNASLYTVIATEIPGFIVPAYNEDWPDVRPVPNAVEIEFTAGYGAAETDVPDSLRHAMLLLISEWFEHTEEAIVGTIINEIPIGVASLLDQYRVWRV